MNTSKSAIIIITILLVAGLIGYYLYLENNRYEISTSPLGIAYQVDKKTGQTWMIQGGTKIPHDQTKLTKEATAFPSQERRKVIGRALSFISGGSFKGKIYNGSNWEVSEFTVELQVKEKDGSLRWSRKYRVSINLLSLQAETFFIEVIGQGTYRDFSWNIVEIKGYAP